MRSGAEWCPIAATVGWVGTDSGGTFTDIVTSDGRIAKVLSTPAAPAAAVAAALDAVAADPARDR